MQLRVLQNKAWSLATGTKYAPQLAVLLWIVDLVLSSYVVLRVPYTEIDWKAYMEQVALVIKGERNYAKIRGGTGPLVYPAGHVYIFGILYKLTDNGQNIFRAQLIFMGLYMATLALVMKSYIKAKAPLYCFPALILSKRLHSIYMLRLFNDGFAIFVTYIAIYLWQNHFWLIGSILFSFGVSIKMNVLLFLPAVGVILLQTLGPKAFRAAMFMLQVQIIVAYPFTSKFLFAYVTRAFQFSRAFLYEWTVNWRFVDENVFRSPEFAHTLLIIHGIILTFFIFTRWMKPSNMNLISIIQTVVFPTPRPLGVQNAIIAKTSPQFILKTLYTCNLIGVLCARSLHYQFYSWFAWSIPYLLSVTGWSPLIQLPVWVAEEWAWNTYPSTKLSSLVVVATNAAIICSVWFGTQKDFDGKAAMPPEMSSISVTETTPVIPASSANQKPLSRAQRRRKSGGR